MTEAKEETGIDCRFVKLASISEFHDGRGPSREGASDLYCIAVLNAVNETQKTPQVEEIDHRVSVDQLKMELQIFTTSQC